MPSLDRIVAWLDRKLRTAEIIDYPNAWNGLQIENSGAVTKIGAAVDACEAVLVEAVEREITLLLVHHGLFWPGVQPVTGAVRRKLKLALTHDLAVYSSHLPLDLHPQLGNNVLLARALGFTNCEPFFATKGQSLGVKTKLALPRGELARRLEGVLGCPPHLAPGGPERTKCIGVVSGGAGGEVAHAAAEGVDTFITGEGPHHSYAAAEELGVNLFYGGHYATETFGVKVLAELAAKRFPRRHDVTMVVRPTPHQRVELTNELHLTDSAALANALPHLGQKDLDVLSGGPDKQLVLEFAEVLAEEVEPLRDGRDAGLLG